MSAFPTVYVRVKPIRLLCCNLCGKIFDCSDELILHFAKHFAPGDCMQCNQQLIEIRDQIYHLQLTPPCEKKESNVRSSICIATYANFNDIKIEPDLEIHEQNEPNDCVALSTIANDLPKLSPDVESSDDFKWLDYPGDTESELVDNELPPSASKFKKRAKKRPKKPRARPLPKSMYKYECYICKKSIEYLPPLQRHIRTHYEGKPTCTICGKEFSDISYLRQHGKLHLDHKQFICTYCGKGFHKRINMESHIVCHTGERNHKCEVCGKLFGRRTNLLNHRRVHTGEKPYKCGIENCVRAYMYKVDLKRHLYGAHGIYTKKYECTICGKILPENKLLVAHMKTH